MPVDAPEIIYMKAESTRLRLTSLSLTGLKRKVLILRAEQLLCLAKIKEARLRKSHPSGGSSLASPLRGETEHHADSCCALEQAASCICGSGKNGSHPGRRGFCISLSLQGNFRSSKESNSVVPLPHNSALRLRATFCSASYQSPDRPSLSLFIRSSKLPDGIFT